MKKRLYLFGSNIKDSLSPLIHKIIFQEMDINADYFLFPTDSIDNVKGIDFFSANITSPFKERIIKYLDYDYSECKSVNTITREGNILRGYSTDGLGFLLDAKRLNLDLKKVLILGTGGASRSIAYAIKDKSQSITIYNRVLSKAQQLATEINAKATDLKSRFDADLVINATGANISEFNVDFKCCYDLRYSKEIADPNGLGMLIYQAILSDEIFFNKKIDYDIFELIHERISNEKNN